MKLLLKEVTLFEPSESQLVATCCKISCKSLNLSMHIKGYENLPKVFESEGIIFSKYNGTAYVKHSNYRNNQRSFCLRVRGAADPTNRNSRLKIGKITC